ncbi:MAG TPA: MFS transporter [Candidatus Dormibacteraeota bacterium]|nr:MFS transporter [Candidatus Dormibacteraeota bacterium]
MTTTTAPATTSRSPFGVRDFRLLWTGEAISSLGDQFALIALPWLALVLTGSALALGGVLALMAVPRALLMIVGGVSVDRFSPRRVMLGSNAVRLVAVTALGLVVLAGAAQLWMLYAFALVFGVADAFFFPAQTSIVPELVEGDQLQRANGIVQGTAQATVLVGPAIAGVVIAALGSGSAGATDGGIGIALLFDAATFLASLVTLWLIRPRAHNAQEHGSILESIREGVRFVWSSPGLRAVIVVSLAGNLFIVGPFEVGMPFIAYSRLPEGAAGFGIVMAAFGGGSLLGLIIASILPAPRGAWLGPIVIGTLAVAGLGVAAIAFVHTTLLAALVIGISGTALGVGNLLGITWIQGRIPPELMGRVMSLMITGSVGLIPLSMFVAGAAVQLSVDGTMIVAGCGMALLALGSLLSPSVRNLGLEQRFQQAPAAAPAGSATSATEDAAPA